MSKKSEEAREKTFQIRHREGYKNSTEAKLWRKEDDDDDYSDGDDDNHDDEDWDNDIEF